jgi:hypothetical protein
MSRRDRILSKRRSGAHKAKAIVETIDKEVEDSTKKSTDPLEIGTPYEFVAYIDEIPTYYKQKRFYKEYAKLHQGNLDIWYENVKFQDEMKRVIKPETTKAFMENFMQLGNISDDNPRVASRNPSDQLMSVHSHAKAAEEKRLEEQRHKSPDIGSSRLWDR